MDTAPGISKEQSNQKYWPMNHLFFKHIQTFCKLKQPYTVSEINIFSLAVIISFKYSTLSSMKKKQGKFQFQEL